MNFKRNIIILLGFAPIAVFSQPYKVTGTVYDKNTGEPMIGAAVFELNTVTTGTATNVVGQYKLIFDKKKIYLKAAYIGYADTVSDVTLTGDTVIDFYLRSNTEIAEVEVEDEEVKWKPEDHSIAGPLKYIPASLLSQPVYVKSKDISSIFPKKHKKPGSLKDIYMTHGSGYIQNTVYLDGARIYAPQPIFDQMLVAEDETIGSLNYFYGNYPARYPSQNNALIDIWVREGNHKRYSGKLYIDFMHAGLSAEGPVLSGKSSFFISARKSYFNNPYTNLFIKDASATNELAGKPVFFDLNFKYTHQLTENDRVSYHFYTSRNSLKTDHSESYTDSIEYSFEKQLKVTTANTAMSLNYRHVFTSDLIFDAAMIFSRYHLKQSISGDSMGLFNSQFSFINRYDAAYTSGNEDFGFKANVLWNLNDDHRLNIGASVYDMRFRPVDAKMTIYDIEHDYDIDTTWYAEITNVQEYGIYAEDRFSLSDRFTGNIGFRFSIFKNGDAVFYSPQPRIYAEYRILKNLSVHASYNYYNQFLHQLSNYTFGQASYVYVPANAELLPIKTHKINGGAELQLPYDIFLNADAFFELSGNLREYKTGFGFFDNPGSIDMPGMSLGERTTFGKANIYGLKVVIQKQLMNFNFKIGHTVTNADFVFDTINFGETYQYPHVNRHDFNLKISYDVNENFKVYAEWMYKSGNFITPRKQSYIPYDYRNSLLGTDTSGVVILSTDGNILYNVGYRNNYQLPSFHRLDLGAEYQSGNHTFGIRIYNVYNRKNTDYIDFKEGVFSNSGTLQTVKYTLIPFFPTLSYSYTFK